ncbi:MAG: FHA domain-containing protein [Nannocystaceae bacterium]
MGRTLRQFTCRDDLWARVEALAQRRDISTDDVVQAALVQLFTKKKGPSPNGEAKRAAPPSPGIPRPSPPAGRGRPAPLPRPPAGGGRLPPPNGGAVVAADAKPKTRPLYLYFEGQCYAIDQEQFVIGRGSKYSDLPIKDANISRRHCAIVRREGDYFVKDLGSTNGVEFNGERVDNHKIEEGTLYRLCDHELRFSFIPPA